MGSELIANLIIYMVVLLMAISAHEAAHAWMSLRFGDDTAEKLGRVTLNPISHTDPVGTLLIPILGFFLGAMGGAAASIPLIGWGKPTPVNPLKWRNKNVANVMVSLAGILVNILLCVIGIVIFKILQKTGGFDSLGTLAVPVSKLLIFMVIMNASLAIFNLLPFPPLDGSKVLETFLPASAEPTMRLLEQYGFLILMVLMYLGVMRAIFTPVAQFLYFILGF